MVRWAESFVCGFASPSVLQSLPSTTLRLVAVVGARANLKILHLEARGIAPTRGSGVATDGIVLIQIIHADSLVVSSVDANALQQNSRATEVEQCQYYQHQRLKTQRHEVRLEQRLRPAAKALRDGDPQRDWRSGRAGLTD